jgi:flagellar biogenesis protein FliO
MKKRKNKKLKNQFKKLLNEQLSKSLKENPKQLGTIETERKKTKEVSHNDNPYAKKDIVKTLIIALFIILGIFAVFYFLKINDSTKGFTESLLKFFSL